MEEIIKSLTSLDSQIEDAKRSIAIKEGRLEETMKQLVNEFGLLSVEEAEGVEQSEKVELGTMEKDIRQRFSELKEGYDW